MKLDDRLYEAFLDEMHELESFRMAYASAHPQTPLERDDPDVKRLTEAMAFFAARTRTAALRQVEASRRRIFQQLFPYLLSPLPAMGLLRAVPSAQFAEPVVLPAGAELELRADSGEEALFCAVDELRIMPFAVGRVDTLLLSRGGYRVVFPLRVPFARNDEIGQLRLHVNHLNDYIASLMVHDALQRHLRRIQVVFDPEQIDETTRGADCPFSFGGAGEAAGRGALWAHPLEAERAFFHCPEADLYLNLELPPPPRNWQQATLLLDLDARWPASLRLSREILQLFVVPIVNLQRAPAAPLIYDGTQERCPLRHQAPERRFALHSVRGVYRVDAEQMTPLRPGTLAGGSGSYELEEQTDRAGRTHHWLYLHLPQAFATPVTVATDASWTQPWFSRVLDRKLGVVPYRHTFVGLKWELCNELQPHRDSGFAESMDTFLHLFALQNKTQLSLDDLRILLETLGSVWSGPFGQLAAVLRELRVEEVPPKSGDGRAAALPKLVYRLRFDEADEGSRPLIDLFCRRVQRVLDLWISDAAVEVRGEVAR